MKKIDTFLISVVIALLLVSGFQIVYARYSETTNDQIVQSAEAEDNYATIMQLPSQNEATSTILVDLSDVDYFPHYKNTGAIQISQIKVIFDASNTSNASSTVKIGVIASTTPTGDLVDVKYFDTVSFSTTNTLHKEYVFDYSPSLMKAGLTSATTTSFLSSMEDLSTSDFATTSTYFSPRGIDTTNPGVGDIVLRVEDMTGIATITAVTLYNVK